MLMIKGDTCSSSEMTVAETTIFDSDTTAFTVPSPFMWGKLFCRYLAAINPNGGGEFRAEGGDFRAEGGDFRAEGDGFRAGGSGFRAEGGGFRAGG
eukprot:1729837-Pyramimonas_sp.AAC.1